jgi:hypothetical protein
MCGRVDAISAAVEEDEEEDGVEGGEISVFGQETRERGNVPSDVPKEDSIVAENR